MHRSTVALAIVLLAAAAGTIPTATGAGASTQLHSTTYKKVCKTVTKKVHGRKRRVKTCHTVKSGSPAAPTATSTSTAAPTSTTTATATAPAAPTAASCLVGSWDASSIWTAIGAYIRSKGVDVQLQQSSGSLQYNFSPDGTLVLQANHASAGFSASGLPATLTLNGTAVARWSNPAVGTVEFAQADTSGLTYTLTVAGQDLSQSIPGLLGSFGLPSGTATDDPYTCTDTTLQLTLPLQPTLIVSLPRISH
ncbi:MAG TPA: hypothetical protein VF221_05005 [Chloroflexota bacterium]